MPELVLIVAATRSMGIGLGGHLPWKGLKREMAYFADVTKRVPSLCSGTAGPNAVIMGRNTWDSIPLRFRPLVARINVVLTSRPLEFSGDAEAAEPAQTDEMMVVTATSVADALEKLRERDVARVFVIGGATVYAAALEEHAAEATRILLTSVKSDVECDTFFPLHLGDSDGTDRAQSQSAQGWTRASHSELQRWLETKVPEGDQSEAGLEYEFQMWEKKST